MQPRSFAIDRAAHEFECILILLQEYIMIYHFAISLMKAKNMPSYIENSPLCSKVRYVVLPPL